MAANKPSRRRLKFCRAVESRLTCSIVRTFDTGIRSADTSTSLTARLTLMGATPGPGADQDGARLEPVHQCHGAVQNLGWRLVHDRRWIDVQPLTHIADHPDNLCDSGLVAGTQPGSDDNRLADGVGIRPVFACHGLADDHGPARLRVAQKAAGEQRNAQDFEVVRRDNAPLDVAGEVVALERPPSGNAEEHVLAAPKRKRAGEGRGLHAGKPLRPLDEIPCQAVDPARFRIGRARQRYLHGEKVAGVKAQTHGMHGRKAANQQYGPT